MGGAMGSNSIPFAVERDFYLSNLKSVVTEPITEAEMEEIAGIDKNCRLIKGQVFLWEGADDWRDLWDLDGEVKTWD